MKGLIFCEFLDMVEKEFGYEIVDNILEKSQLPSKGIYTAVGTYSHHEMFVLVKQLSKQTNIEISRLFYTYGVYVFGVFGNAYRDMVVGYNNSFDFLASVEDTIHVQVLKLYPEAELPSIKVQKRSENQMELLYVSQRKMSAFAHGLIQGCVNFFDETAEISKTIISEDNSQVLFTINKKL